MLQSTYQLLVFITLIIILACSKWDLDRIEFTKVITVGAIEVGASDAFLIGDMEHLRNAVVDQTGFVVSSSQNTDESLRIGSSGVLQVQSTGNEEIVADRAFAARATGLASGTKYFFRAYLQIAGENETVYGSIDTFFTKTISTKTFSIESIQRLSTDCPIDANVILQLDFSVAELAEVEFGLVWVNDVFTLPTISDNVVLGNQIGSSGKVAIPIQLECDQIYNFRAFVQIPGQEAFYSNEKEFATYPGGKWSLVGDCPEDLNRDQCVFAFATDNHGYLLAFNKVQTEVLLWKFNPLSHTWESSTTPDYFGMSCDFFYPTSTGRFLLTFFNREYDVSENAWTKIWPSLPNKSVLSFREDFSFEYNNNLYALDFYKSLLYTPGFWKVTLDHYSQTNQRLPDFPGEPRRHGSSFIVGSKGFVGLGVDSTRRVFYKDFWAFDFISEIWTQISDCPEVITAGARYIPSFSMNGRGYILTGQDQEGNPLPYFYEYDPESDQWNRLADFGRGDGNADVGFAINGRAYGGLGISKEGSERREIWRYVPEL